MKMNKQHVIIVGAGASGLMAAVEIADKCTVTILEANHEIGGRIRTMPMKSGEGVIEPGAEFVHGATPITTKLVKEAGLKVVKLEGKMLRKHGKQWNEEHEMIEGWDELVKKMKGLKNDTTMDHFMQEHFAGDKYAELRRHIKAFVQGFDVADTSAVSVQALYKEWSNESDQFRISTGYNSLVSYVENKCINNGCAIIKGKTVKQIDWQKNDVTVYTADGEKFSGNKVIITIPVSVLRDLNGKAAINLSPPVDEYINAARKIGYGTVIKLIFELKEPVWKNETGFIFSDEMIPTWWTRYPVNNNLITGWAGGPVASQLSQHTDDELFEIGVISLSNIFDLAVPAMRNIIAYSHIFNWSKYHESLGAYSFPTPDSVSARELLNTPLEGTVYFAGEGLYDGPYSGTVEAALSSGSKTAASLLRTLT
jgi:monoamine oxidase